jgi:Protein of unknown function, DUF599
MSNTLTWLAALTTVAMLIIYEVVLVFMRKRSPMTMARTAHAGLREEWFEAITMQPGSEILAVQTLRNSLMSATMIASTSVLGLMGTVTLAAPTLHATFGNMTSGAPNLSPRTLLELMLLALLFASLVSSVMAVRYYNHAGFISSMPVGSAQRSRWNETGIAYVRRAGTLYSWGLRHLILVAPILASMLYPAAGPMTALVMIAVLFGFDRFDGGDLKTND